MNAGHLREPFRPPSRRFRLSANDLPVTIGLTVATLMTLSAPPLTSAQGHKQTEEGAEPESPRRYGDRGTHHLGVVLGLGGGSGGVRYAAGVDYGYFVWDGIAPGAQALISGGSDVLTTGMTMGTLRLVPIRTSSLSLFLVGRAGRVFLSDHEDGWGAGGSGGVIFFTGGRIGLQLAYEVLRLFPEQFCVDLESGCLNHGLEFGVVVPF